MQLHVLVGTFSAVFTAVAALETGGSQRDVTAGRRFASQAGVSATSLAEAWLQSHSSVSDMPDELAELKGQNPEAYAIVQALLAKRSLGLLKLRSPSHSFAGTSSAEETQLSSLVPAASLESTSSVPRASSSQVSAPTESVPEPSRTLSEDSLPESATSQSISWSNPFSFAPGAHVLSGTGTGNPKRDSSWVAVHEAYEAQSTSRPDVLASFHWDDGARVKALSTSLPISTTQKPPARQQLSSWLHNKVSEKVSEKASIALGPESKSFNNAIRVTESLPHGAAKASLTTLRQSNQQLRQSTQKSEYMNMLGPIDDSQQQTSAVDGAEEEPMNIPLPVPLSNAREDNSKRFPLESFSFDDEEKRPALSSLSKQSQLDHTASDSKKGIPEPAEPQKPAETPKVRLQPRKKFLTAPSEDDANPYLKGLDFSGPAAAIPVAPKENPYLAALD